MEYIEDRIKDLEEKARVLEKEDNDTAEVLMRMWKEIEKLRCEIRGVEYVDPFAVKPTNQSTEEFVKVVRCGECKYNDDAHGVYCPMLEVHKPDGYCYKGEPK